MNESGVWILYTGNVLSHDFSVRSKIELWLVLTKISKKNSIYKCKTNFSVVVDTFPSGGGVVIKDAMALGAPVVSFKHDYMKTFSQTECSAAEEVIGMPELLIERGDFGMLNKVLSKLITNREYREDLSEICQAVFRSGTDR